MEKSRGSCCIRPHEFNMLKKNKSSSHQLNITKLGGSGKLNKKRKHYVRMQFLYYTVQ